MFSILRTSLARLPAVLPKQTILNQCSAMFHALSKPNITNANQVTNTLFQSRILTPTLIPNCGFKVKGRLKRRCKDCYFVVRDKRLFVICKTHPRHKQMSMVPREKNTWILSHATMGKVRPW